MGVIPITATQLALALALSTGTAGRWTNTARHTTYEGRVLSPAAGVAETGVCNPSMSCAPFPHYTDECHRVAEQPLGALNRRRAPVQGDLISRTARIASF